MKKIFILMSFFVCTALSAQDNCYFPTQKGAELAYKYYNRRNKPLKDKWDDERWMKFRVEEVWRQDNSVIINVAIENEAIDRFSKNENFKQIADNLSYGDVKIEGDTVTLDNMQWLVDVVPMHFVYMLRDGNKSTEQKYHIEMSALSSFPRRLEVGDTLPDEDIMDVKYTPILTAEEKAKRDVELKEFEMEISALGGLVVGYSTDETNITAQTRNRMVTAFEKVTTPAGTFDCYKITYELVLPQRSIFDRNFSMTQNNPQPKIEKYADWMSPEVGLVKREKYNERGKVQEKMVLDSYKK